MDFVWLTFNGIFMFKRVYSYYACLHKGCSFSALSTCVLRPAKICGADIITLTMSSFYSIRIYSLLDVVENRHSAIFFNIGQFHRFADVNLVVLIRQVNKRTQVNNTVL